MFCWFLFYFSELRSNKAVDDEVDRRVEDDTVSSNEVPQPLAVRSKVECSLSKTHQNCWNSTKNKLIKKNNNCWNLLLNLKEANSQPGKVTSNKDDDNAKTNTWESKIRFHSKNSAMVSDYILWNIPFYSSKGQFLPPSYVKSVWEVCWILLEDLVVDHNEDEDRDDDGGE